MPPTTAVMVIDDLFFVAKVQAPLISLGLTSRVVTSRTTLEAYLQTAPVLALMVIDLTLRSDDAIAMIQTLRASPHGAVVPILAFGAHVAVDVNKQALAAGATRVVAKSMLSGHCVELVHELLAPAGTAED